MSRYHSSSAVFRQRFFATLSEIFGLRRGSLRGLSIAKTKDYKFEVLIWESLVQ